MRTPTDTEQSPPNSYIDSTTSTEPTNTEIQVIDQQQNGHFSDLQEDLETLTTQIQELQEQTQHREDLIDSQQLESFLATGYYAYTFFIVLAVAYIAYRCVKLLMSFITDFLS